MPDKSFHISEQELLLAVDGELSSRQMAKVREHLAACWSCRARMGEIEASILEYVRIHHRNLGSQLPPSDGPRAQFRTRLAELAESGQPGIGERLLAWCFTKRVLVPVCVALTMVLGLAAWRLQRETVEMEARADHSLSGLIPDPALTPGTTQPLTSEELCALTMEDSVPKIPRPAALRVFESYGIHDPRPRAYELDYLITPELGGTSDVRNLWPQPYRAGSWNAHAKDALEDRLHGLVCAGKLDLGTAQRDLAANWIAAYRKYFQTEEPLPIHTAFLKDQPWE